jgi:outer membrane receptor protein involved in Fe transport
MHFDRRLLLSTAALSAVLLSSGTVGAQTSAAAKAPADEVVEEIVVTALKRSTTLQTTPMAISAVTGDSLEKLGATGLADYFRQVPGVNLTQGQLGQSRVTIRGVQGSGEATTGLYYDETPVTGPSGTTQDPGNNAADLNLFDVERVEVLRGPQGTLYGGGSMGGTLRVIYNKPNSQDFGAAIEAQASDTKGGSAGSYLKAMGNIPLIQGKLAARITAYTEDRPGYVDNVKLKTKDVNDSRSSGYRAMLGFTPTDDLSLTATKVHQSTSADDMEGWYQRVGKYETDSTVKLPLNTQMDLTSLTGKWNSADRRGDRGQLLLSLRHPADHRLHPAVQALYRHGLWRDRLPAGQPPIVEPRAADVVQGRRAVAVDGRRLHGAAQGPHRQQHRADRSGHRPALQPQPLCHGPLHQHQHEADRRVRRPDLFA